MVDLGFVEFDGGTIRFKNPINGDSIAEFENPIDVVNRYIAMTQEWLQNIYGTFESLWLGAMDNLGNFVRNGLAAIPNVLFGTIGKSIKAIVGWNDA